MLGEADLVASGREDGARVVNSPDTSMTREVNDVRSWVILHERTGVVCGAEPRTSQRNEKALPRAAEDLKEDRNARKASQHPKGVQPARRLGWEAVGRTEYIGEGATGHQPL